MTTFVITYTHATSKHSYIVDQETADKLMPLLKNDSDVTSVTALQATAKDISRFNNWLPSTKIEDWLRIAKEQYFTKLVPLTDKDCRQPQESSLMSALSRIGAATLISHGINNAVGITSHKILS